MARAHSKENALGKLLDASPLAVYVLDDQRQIIYCNTACGELLGLDGAQLIGQRCVYRVAPSGSTLADIAASLCPPPEVLSGQLVSTNVSALHASGALLTRSATFVPLGSDELADGGVVALVSLAESAARAEWDPAAAAEASALHHQLARARRELLADWSLDELVGNSPAIHRVRDQVALAARSKTRVLVQGPPGSGREHVAKLLHRGAMPGAWEPLVPLWCPLLDAELIQSTITAFVREFNSLSAEVAREGRPDTPRVPTLLLLEVDQLPPDAQAELAGFLALPGFELHAIATAQEPLFPLAERGGFRVDLAHALSTLVIDMPSLMARPEDIPLLCQCFVERFNVQGGRQLSGFTSEALDLLSGYTWPENLDELADVVAHACQAADGPLVDSRHLPDKIRWAQQVVAHPRREADPIVLDQFLEEIEKELLARALKRAKGNKTKAAKLLGMTRARFHRRLDHFDLSR
ncbi:MAG: AAA-type ATPase lid domain-containing protein [Pirellulaceae bacterium]